MDTQAELRAQLRAHVWTLESTAPNDLGRIARALRPGGGAAVLSTCTRVERYGTAEAPAGGDLAPPEVLSGREALEHVALVAAGADSLVVGETDVLAQVRSAFSETAGPCGSSVMRRSRRGARRGARSSSRPGMRAISWSWLSVSPA